MFSHFDKVICKLIFGDYTYSVLTILNVLAIHTEWLAPTQALSMHPVHICTS